MPAISPIQYRFSLIKEALSWKNQIIYEVLLCYRDKLPSDDIEVSWKRDGKFIVGVIKVGKDTYMTQGRTAKEFVEMVNDALYAAYEVPPFYAQQLGGNYRIMPSKEAFDHLNNAAIKKSNICFSKGPVTA